MNHSISARPQSIGRAADPARRAWSLSATLRGWLIALALILECALPIWLSTGDHPLYAPDEGRYGSVSINMVETGNWLVPMMNGKAHLTKPPLVYWLQATCTMLLGDDEFALRLPSLIASTMTLLITFGLALRWGGARRALVATGLLSLAPLHLLVGRLAITDATLTMCWTAALAAGVMAIQPAEPSRPSWPWAGAMWAAVAVGLMTKGPLALVPVGLLLLWILLTGQRGAIRRLHIALGLPLAIVPIGIWVGLILSHEPQAIAIWKHEMLDRASGAGDHPEPFWYYIPIVIGGLFPITTTLSLPGLDYSWRDAWKCCRSTQLTSLLVLAVIAPFIGFSLMGGKLATYVLPIGPPLALLGAKVLEARFLGHPDRVPNDRQSKLTLAAITIAMAIVVAAMVFAGLRVIPDGIWAASMAIVAPIATLLMWMKWSWIASHPTRRIASVALLWAAGATSWTGVFEFEDAIAQHYGTQPLMAEVHAMPGMSDPIVATVGYQDLTLFRYLNTPARALKNAEILNWLASLAPEDRLRAAILAKEETWRDFSERHPEVTSLFEEVGRGTYRFSAKVLIVRPKSE